MKPSHRRLLLLGVPVFLVLVAVWIAKTPMHPVAYVRVLSETGTPVAGAVVLPEGLRTKPGPYVSGWYGWRTQKSGGVPNPPVTTDKDGYARVAYPKHVFERIETGTLCLSVSHPDFVPERPERVVATSPPAGAPWQARANHFLNLIQDFAGVSDAAGLAILPNVPASVTELYAEHPRFILPAVGTVADGKRRQASFTLIPGQTNRVFIQLEPREQMPISHY